LGSGVVGRTLAKGFLKHGYEVMLGTRDPGAADIEARRAKTARAKVGTFAEAARFGDIIVLAVLGRVAEKVIELSGVNNLAGKPLIDATNPLADEPPVEGVLKFTTGLRVTCRAPPGSGAQGQHRQGLQQRRHCAHGQPALRARSAHNVHLRQ
jgi:ketol-acid reductoisomerase